MPLALLARPTVILGILLALSVGANALLFKLHSRDLVKIGALEAQREDAVADARACSEGVKKLLENQEERDREVAAALRIAERKEREAEERADKTLQSRPSKPGDPCASALELDRQKLRERRRP